MYKRLLTIGLVFATLTGLAVCISPAKAQAYTLPTGVFADDLTVTCGPNEVRAKDYRGKEDKFSCCPKSAGSNPTGTVCFIKKYVDPIINLLAALVGVVVLGSVVFGGIQYSTSAGDPNKAAAARQRIINSLLALAAFVFLYAFLQWLMPGGIGD